MNKGTEEALRRYRRVKFHLMAIEDLTQELEMIAWKEFLNALEAEKAQMDDDEEEDSESYLPGRCAH
jgi:hypothetical protein